MSKNPRDCTSMEEASSAVSEGLKYHPGHITGLSYADGHGNLGYGLFFDSTDNTYNGWVACSEGNFEIGKEAYTNKLIVAGFISTDHQGSNTLLGQIFIYPQ